MGALASFLFVRLGCWALGSPGGRRPGCGWDGVGSQIGTKETMSRLHVYIDRGSQYCSQEYRTRAKGLFIEGIRRYRYRNYVG